MLDFELIKKILEEKESLSEEELKLYKTVRLIIKRDELNKEYQENINIINKELQEILQPVEENK